jgi:hypothetical protein
MEKFGNLQTNSDNKQYYIPMEVTSDTIKALNINSEDLRWTKIGNRKVRCIMIEATKEQYYEFMRPLWWEDKHLQRQESSTSLDELFEETEYEPTDTYDLESDVMKKVLINELHKALAELEEIDRIIVDMYSNHHSEKKKKEMSKTDKERAATSLIQKNPEIIDYYIKYKEENQEQASSISKQVVEEVKTLFNTQLQELTQLLYEKTDFYKETPSSYDEAYKRVQYLKAVIEDMDGYRIFYLNGKPIKRENDLQIMYRLVWYASEFDANREVNNGRGPVDYKVSKGSKNSSLVEFKLASNIKLKKNIQNQVEIYKKANFTDRAIKVILFFTDQELEKVNTVLNELGLSDCKDIVLIDARNNKVSASNV